MINLKIPHMVEEDAVARALLGYCQGRLYGPEFNVGDLVRFKFMGGGEGPQDEQLGCVASVFPDYPGYGVAYVNAAGDICSWRVKAFKLVRAEVEVS